MAFKGGFLVNPTTTSTDALAGLYLNGIKAIADKKREIQKEELGILKEATEATNIPVSGVSTIDSLMGQYGVSKRNSIQELFEARKRGEISTDQYTMGMINHTSETKLFSRLPEFIAKENSEIQKGIEEGKLSGINADYNLGRFRDLNSGNPEAENQVLTPYHINGQGFIRLDYTVNGEPKDQNISITKLMDPNKKRILRFDLDDYTKKFKDGLEQKDYLTVREVERNGVKYIEKTVDASKSFETKQSVNRNVAYLDDDAIIDILYQKLGTRLDYASDYKQYTEEEIKNRFGYKTDRFSIDIDEEGIEILPEDLTFEVKDNKIVVDERKARIARGIVRAELYDTLGIKKTAEIIKEEKSDRITAREEKRAAFLQGRFMNSFNLNKILGEEYSKDRFMKEALAIPLDERQGFLNAKLNPRMLRAVNSDDMTSVNIGEKIQEDLAKISPNTVTGVTMDRVSNIVVSTSSDGSTDNLGRQREEYNIFLMGSGFMGEETTKVQSLPVEGGSTEGVQDVRTLTTRQKLDQGITPPLDENKAAELYLELYEGNDIFRATADNAKFGGKIYGAKGAVGAKNKYGREIDNDQVYQRALVDIINRISSGKVYANE